MVPKPDGPDTSNRTAREGGDAEEPRGRPGDPPDRHTNRRGVLRGVAASTVAVSGVSAAASPAGAAGTDRELDDGEIRELLAENRELLEHLASHDALRLGGDATVDTADVDALATRAQTEVTPVNSHLGREPRPFLVLETTGPAGEVVLGFDLDRDHAFVDLPDPVDGDAMAEDWNDGSVGTTDDCPPTQHEGCCCNMANCTHCPDADDPTIGWCNACECTYVYDGVECNLFYQVCDCCRTHIWCSIYCPNPSYNNC